MLVFQLCSLSILLIISISYKEAKKLNTRKSFVGMIIMTGVTLVVEMVVTLTLNFEMAEWFRKVIIKIYFLLLSYTSYYQFAFMVARAVKGKLRDNTAKFSIVVPFIITILVFAFDVGYKVTPNGLSLSGYSYYSAYASGVIYGLLIILILYLQKDTMNVWYRICFIMQLCAWTLCAVIQYFSPRIGIITIALLATLYVLFIFVENPLNYIDYEYDCFKNSEIEPYIDSVLEENEKKFVVFASIQDTRKLQVKHNTVGDLKKKIVSELNSVDGYKIFVTGRNELLIIGENIADLSDCLSLIDVMVQEYYEQTEEKKSFKSIVLYCKNLHLFGRSDYVVDYFRKNLDRFQNNKDYSIAFELTDINLDLEDTDKAIKDEIVAAYNEDRIEAFVQPIYSVAKGKIVSAEALARIRKRDGSMLLPYQFIPVSERCGLDVVIGYRILEKICQLMKDPVTSQLFEYVDINLSINQAEAGNLASKIISITQKYDVRPSKLNFEITETGYINKMSNIERNIRALTDYGFGFSLDDFGSGESNLNYLISMPVSYVKIDMNMIWAYFKNVKAEKTVQSIIKISHDLGMKIIAEGVETEDQLIELSKQGVDFIQGYYFYKPMSVTDYLEIKKKEESED